MDNERRSKIVVDTEKNRLSITLEGMITRKEMDRIYADIVVCTSELQPGFAVITDLSKCTIAHLSGLPTFKKIMEVLVENKVGKVVRVVGKSKVIFNQISRVTGHMKGYRPIYVVNLDEAEKVLSTMAESA